MKPSLLSKACLGLGSLLLLPGAASAQVVISEQFETGYDRTTQNIAGGNMAIYKARSGTTATVSEGSLAFSAVSSSGSSQYFGYFTDPGANVGTHVNDGHVTLGVGDTLSVRVTFNLSAVPTDTTFGLRFGLFDDTGSRQTADLNSGGNSAAFVGNTGYALFVPMTSQEGLNNQLSIRSRETTTAGNIFNTANDFPAIGAVGGAYTPLVSGADYQLTFSVFRQSEGTTVLSASILSGDGSTTMTAGSVEQTTGTQTDSFSWLAWRPPSETAGGTTTFKDVTVTVTPVPEPGSVALLGLGAAALFLRSRRRG